ncbi:hypothetical protein F0562_011718 [Nyssa sinensis]|uniref:Uncharacterized protein n=1 Tax=Nyssa sinensis TaxID=561372 RepID=A0A5J4ZST8_9ASTE|nr:hypothetical protein F0562_011718 [Nyssa sinensis]
MTVAPSSLTPSLFCAEHLAATGIAGFVCQPKSLGVLALAREGEIERKKMEVREKVEFQLGRAEEETRRLAQVWEVFVSRPNGEKCSIVLCPGSPEVLNCLVWENCCRCHLAFHMGCSSLVLCGFFKRIWYEINHHK